MWWSSRLFWRVLCCYGVVTLLFAICFLVISTHWQHDHVIQQVEQRLHDSAVMLREIVGDDVGRSRAPEFQRLVESLGRETGTRLTIIDQDGTVLGDSLESHERMENHIDRLEIQQAKREGYGRSQRASRTLGYQMLYVAVPIPRKETPRAFVRVAMSVESIQQEVASVQRRLWLVILVLGLVTLVITYILTDRLIRPLHLLTQSAQTIASGQYGHPVRIDSNDEIGMLGDAFERMRVQLDTQVKELSEQAKRQATVFRSMLEGIIVVDAKGRVTLANQAAERLLSFASRDPVGKGLDQLITSQATIETVNEALRREVSVAAEVEIRGGETKIVALQATRLPGSPCPGVVVVARDVTALRQLENMRRDFAANVSHELKTPLTSIKAYAETLRLGAIHDDKINIGFLSRIEEQAERLHQLILDLIQLSRIESGEEVLDIRDVALADVIAGSVASRRDAASAKNISLVTDPPPYVVTIRADEEGVRTILDNLIDNAVKYTPENGEVRVRWSVVDGDVVTEVQDTGIGIAKEEQGRIFERFYRVDKARSREMGGTGLGLSIVKHMTQSLGGTVGLRSTPGEGSTFEIRFPRGEHEVDAESIRAGRDRPA